MSQNPFRFFITAAIFIVINAVTSFALASPRIIKMRQPKNGGIVHRISNKNSRLDLHMQAANLWAERVDAQVNPLMEVLSMGKVERWWKDKDLEAMKVEYSKNILAHLKAMTVILAAHRQHGRFVKLREFEFQNMLRKSDYLLSLYITKESFALKDQLGQKQISKILNLYNKERMLFDRKVITIAGGR